MKALLFLILMFKKVLFFLGIALLVVLLFWFQGK